LPSIAGVVVGSVCAGSSSTNLNYTTTTGSPDEYSIDFDATAEAQGFVDVVNAALPASPITITIPALGAAGNYNAVVTVRNSSASCPSSSVPITITLLANPTITVPHCHIPERPGIPINTVLISMQPLKQKALLTLIMLYYLLHRSPYRYL
jgi:hypothetical protein